VPSPLGPVEKDERLNTWDSEMEARPKSARQALPWAVMKMLTWVTIFRSRSSERRVAYTL
jgi:hypothetical protein